MGIWLKRRGPPTDGIAEFRIRVRTASGAAGRRGEERNRRPRPDDDYPLRARRRVGSAFAAGARKRAGLADDRGAGMRGVTRRLSLCPARVPTAAARSRRTSVRSLAVSERRSCRQLGRRAKSPRSRVDGSLGERGFHIQMHHTIRSGSGLSLSGFSDDLT